MYTSVINYIYSACTLLYNYTIKLWLLAKNVYTVFNYSACKYINKQFFKKWYYYIKPENRVGNFNDRMKSIFFTSLKNLYRWLRLQSGRDIDWFVFYKSQKTTSVVWTTPVPWGYKPNRYHLTLWYSWSSGTKFLQVSHPCALRV